MKGFKALLTALFVMIMLSGYAFAQDAAKVDPKHYKVEFENDEVRVLRITYGPGEKSVMHSHPEGVAIFMTDGDGKFTFPDGKTQEVDFKSGKVIWMPETTHQPENIGKEPYEVIQIEMKTKKKE